MTRSSAPAAAVPTRATGVAVAALLLLGAVVVLRGGAPVGLPGRPDCVVAVDGEEVGLTGEEARRLTTLAGVTRRDGLPQRRLAVAARAALDGEGDPPGRAVDALARVPADAVPAAEDVALARALLGYAGGALTCAQEAPEVRVEAEQASGLTPRAERVLGQVRLVFGRSAVGGFAPGGVSTGHVTGSAHYDGRAVDVFYRPVTEHARRAGWTTAQWAVAHAAELGVATVIFDRRIWTAARADEGWRDYRVPDRPGDPAVLAHLDHVHVDVLRGS